MKKILLLLLLFTGPTLLAQENQKITWIGKAAVGGYAPEGTLEIMEASSVIRNDSLVDLSVVVDMRTLDQENTQLREHLRNQDFFYVKKFPVATFILSEAIPLNESEPILKGMMTIRGKTSEEKIKVKAIVTGDIITITLEHTMDRTRYGITYNSPSVFERLKENAIADTFVLRGTIEAEIRNSGN